MEEISDRDITDVPQSNYVRNGVTLVPNSEVGQDVNVSKLWDSWFDGILKPTDIR